MDPRHDEGRSSVAIAFTARAVADHSRGREAATAPPRTRAGASLAERSGDLTVAAFCDGGPAPELRVHRDFDLASRAARYRRARAQLPDRRGSPRDLAHHLRRT